MPASSAASADQRQRAMLEAANVMERITAEPFDEVTAERARRLSITPAAAGSLPGAELAVEVKEERPGPDRSARRIAVRLRWKGRSGEWEAPVRLTTWIERREAVAMIVRDRDARRGVSLIELMVVMTVLAVLSASAPSRSSSCCASAPTRRRGGAPRRDSAGSPSSSARTSMPATTPSSGPPPASG